MYIEDVEVVVKVIMVEVLVVDVVTDVVVVIEVDVDVEEEVVDEVVDVVVDDVVEVVVVDWFILMVADADAVRDALSIAVTVKMEETGAVPMFVPDTVHVVEDVVQPLTIARPDPSTHL